MYTSNVDGHFLKSGFDPKFLCEIHGNLENWMPLEDPDSQICGDDPPWHTIPADFR